MLRSRSWVRVRELRVRVQFRVRVREFRVSVREFRVRVRVRVRYLPWRLVVSPMEAMAHPYFAPVVRNAAAAPAAPAAGSR